jgi:hypothetical protein
MKLPNPDKLIVDHEKITDYLLNVGHRYGANKARFFAQFGFRIENWEQLADALREHGRTHEVMRQQETGFGPPLRGRRRVEYADRPPAAPADGLANGQGRNCAPFDQRLSSGGKFMIKEHDCVVLTKNLAEEKLEAGDIGTVVHIHKGGEGYEVEFMTLTGETVAIVTLMTDQVRPLNRRDLAHTRELQTA